MITRLSTEDINTKEIHKLTSSFFDGFTSYQATGFWKGKEEKSRIIEVVSKYSVKLKMLKLAKKIKKANKQEAVMVQVLADNNEMV